MSFAQCENLKGSRVQKFKKSKFIYKQPRYILKINFKRTWNHTILLDFLYNVGIIHRSTSKPLLLFKRFQAMHQVFETINFSEQPRFNDKIVKRDDIFKNIICLGNIECQDYPGYSFFDYGS
jgi:hypothetical protein